MVKMNNKLLLNIADINLAFSIPEKKFHRLLAQRYKNFSSLHTAGWRIHLSTKKNNSNTEGIAPQLLLKKGKLILLCGDFEIEINLSEHSGKGIIEKNIYSFDSFLRILYTYLLLEKQGFLIHSSGVVKKKQAYLFPGVSMAGKSTIARFSAGSFILSDELVAVRKIGGQYRAYSTPFTGELDLPAQNLSFPINGVYFPRKSQNNILAALTLKQSLPKFLTNILFFNSEKHFLDKIFGIAEDFLLAVPAYKMQFTLTPTFWKIILATPLP